MGALQGAALMVWDLTLTKSWRELGCERRMGFRGKKLEGAGFLTDKFEDVCGTEGVMEETL